jgi:D-amino-acid dehydrogenase
MEVLVIDGGVIGVCSAYYLAGFGCGVTLIEKGKVGAGCSYGNAGLIVPGYSIPPSRSGHFPEGFTVGAKFREPFLD